MLTEHFPRAASTLLGAGSYLSQQPKKSEPYLNNRYLSHRFQLLKFSNSGWKHKAGMHLQCIFVKTNKQNHIILKHEFQHSETVHGAN